ncbi:MAG: hypothetical protein A2W99_03385 [Bacteroidetes bacterium GWF2_33_16]|nr:MAG: hypothetical protein A2X00_11685 [Bacteroidetes bacterium GWE2_32_14]OFY08230.1 MAG: hypothetical protein A2W99_03385 [Bacteroidetes bacterium GWF2_33_16]
MKSIRLINILLIAFISISYCYGQSSKKNLEVLKISNPPVIDGSLTDSCWLPANSGTDFIVCKPTPLAKPTYQTDVKILYNDKGIYIGAMLYDAHPDSILYEAGPRDYENVNADCFAFCISPYNDGQNELIFKITAAGIQIDKKHKGTTFDLLWDAVWESAVKINELGWVVEMYIPYSAIRIPKSDGRSWGMNCWRNIKRLEEWSTWNFVDINNDEWINQSGDLSGIKDINPPLRLSLTPYLSNYYEHYPYNIDGMNNSTYLLNGGMDVKVGLNKSYTLDITLIPDFGQVQSDNRVLNLTPYETKYDEKRPFFTEGTELFNTANIFYSRRIGGMPLDYYKVSSQLAPNEEIIENPTATKMINAIKLTGRSNYGLGIGVFNATTTNTYAKAKNDIGDEKEVLTQPWTNYNILVASQTIGQTSFINLINTNAYYGDGSNMANVTGFDLKFADKGNNWALISTGALSQKYDSSNANPILGSKLNITLAKIGGKFQFYAFNNLMTEKFNPNDLGYITNNNFTETGLKLVYNINKPFWKFNRLQNYFSIYFNRLFEPSVFTGYRINFYTMATLRNNSSIGLNLNVFPSGVKDYYEPRIPGRYYSKPSYGFFELGFSSDSRKALKYEIFTGYSNQGKIDNHVAEQYWILFNPKYRINNKSSVGYFIRYNKTFNSVGFARIDSLIRFGQRNNMVLENSIDARYSIAKNLNVNLIIRHYWSTVKYREFYTLKEDGHLAESDYNNNHNISFNSFNIDLGLTWRFAPGSDLTLVWKNSILDRDNILPDNYFKNIDYTFNQSKMNSISLKAIYYLDYQSFRRR